MKSFADGESDTWKRLGPIKTEGVDGRCDIADSSWKDKEGAEKMLWGVCRLYTIGNKLNCNADS